MPEPFQSKLDEENRHEVQVIVKDGHQNHEICTEDGMRMKFLWGEPEGETIIHVTTTIEGIREFFTYNPKANRMPHLVVEERVLHFLGETRATCHTKTLILNEAFHTAVWKR